MIKKWVFLLILSLSNTALALSSGINKIAPLENIKRVSEAQLPLSYRYLLTQPLMTKAIENYYQRKAIIHTLSSKNNPHTQRYSRTILMLLDRNKVRNKPELAHHKNETIVAELALIEMNLKQLPVGLKTDVRHTNIPFGQLLLKYHIEVRSQNRSYFTVSCTKELSLLTHCPVNKKLYGRTHQLVRKDNQQWVAHVTEILQE